MKETIIAIEEITMVMMIIVMISHNGNDNNFHNHGDSYTVDGRNLA